MNNVIFFVGLVVFFLLGFFAGQSRTWYAIRKMWHHFTTSEDEED